MKKTIDLFGWFMVMITTIVLILTLLTIYQFVYIKYFQTYSTLQWCMGVTMAIWAIKMFEIHNEPKGKFYSALCMVLAFVNMFFLYMGIY